MHACNNLPCSRAARRHQRRTVDWRPVVISDDCQFLQEGNNLQCQSSGHTICDTHHHLRHACYDSYRLGIYRVAISRSDQLSSQSRLASPVSQRRYAVVLPPGIISSFRVFLHHGKSHWLCNSLLNYIGSLRAGADKYIQQADSQWTEKQRVIRCGVHYGVSLQFVSAILSSLVIFHTHSSAFSSSFNPCRFPLI